MKLSRRPLLIQEMDDRLQRLNRARSPGDEATDERYWREMGRVYSPKRVRRLKRRERERNDVAAIKRKHGPEIQALADAALERGDQFTFHTGFHNAHDALSEHIKRHLGYDKPPEMKPLRRTRRGDTRPRSNKELNKLSRINLERDLHVRDMIGKVLSREHFPEGDKGAEAHRRAIGHLYSQRRNNFHPHETFSSSLGLLHDSPTTQSFHKALKHHGYDKDYEIVPDNIHTTLVPREGADR